MDQATSRGEPGRSQTMLTRICTRFQRVSAGVPVVSFSSSDEYEPLNGAPSQISVTAPEGCALSTWQHFTGSKSVRALLVYGELLREPVYASNLAAMVTCTLGLGILNASMLIVLDGVAGRTSAISVNTMVNFQRLERLLHGLSLFVAHVGVDTEYAHQDDEKMSLLAIRQFSHAIVCCSAVDALSSAVIAGGVISVTGAHRIMGPLLGAATLVYPLALVRAAQAFKMASQYGFWDCLKKHLGNESARIRQQRWNRTIVALEMILFSSLADLGSYAIFKGTRPFFKEPTQKLCLGASVALAGGFIACIPKLFFWIQARNANNLLVNQMASANIQEAEI